MEFKYLGENVGSYGNLIQKLRNHNILETEFDVEIGENKYILKLRNNRNIDVVQVNNKDLRKGGYNYERVDFYSVSMGEYDFSEKDLAIFATAEAARFIEAEELVQWHLNKDELVKKPKLWGFSVVNISGELKPNPFWNNHKLFTKKLKVGSMGIYMGEVFEEPLEKTLENGEYVVVNDSDILEKYKWSEYVDGKMKNYRVGKIKVKNKKDQIVVKLYYEKVGN